MSEAIVHFQTALKINPRRFEAYADLGNVSMVSGKTAEAIDDYRKALEIEPNYAIVRYSLGMCLYDQGHFAEAIAEYRKALEIEPRYAKAHNNLGSAAAGPGQGGTGNRRGPGRRLTSIPSSPGPITIWRWRWSAKDAWPRPLATTRARWMSSLMTPTSTTTWASPLSESEGPRRRLPNSTKRWSWPRNRTGRRWWNP